MSTLYFRILQVGGPTDPLLFPIYEEDQKLFLHDYNRAYRLPGTALAALTVDDLPKWVRVGSKQVLLSPVQAVSGAEALLWRSMLDAIQAVREAKLRPEEKVPA